MDPLVNVDGVFPSYYLVDGRASLFLLAAFLCGSHLNDAERHRAHIKRRPRALPVPFPPAVPSPLQTAQLPHSET